MTQEELIIQIAKCEEIENARQDENHPCHSMVANAQTDKNGRILTKEEFHLPEPFNGDIEKADILFVGLNPSFDENECYPKRDWLNKNIEQFFLKRFINKGTSYWKQILAITRTIRENKKLKYNSNILKLLETMDMGKQINVSCTDLGICLTEIIHCKSRASKGIHNGCVSKCVEKHLKHVLSLFKGKYVVIRGAKAKELYERLKDMWQLNKKVKIYYAPYCCPSYPTIENILENLVEI